MDKNKYNNPLPLSQIEITDYFWEQELNLVRKEMIPYQWKALNDQVADAAPSYCIRNFKVAGRLNEKRKRLGEAFEEPSYTYRGFEVLPEDPKDLKEQFYGFVFQDSDLYKWLEAVAYSLEQYPDQELQKTAEEAIDLIINAQQEDGYLNTYYMINGKDMAFTNLRDHHELYCFGHLAEAAVAYYQATGNDKLLKAAERFADCIAARFGEAEGKCKGYPGHEIAEMALVRLYEATGNKTYLSLSSFFINERGTRPYYFDQEHPEAVKKGQEGKIRYEYHQAHVPVRKQEEAVGHAVRGGYLYSGMADAARCLEDETLYEACKQLWNSIVSKKMYITGGIGSTHIGEAFSFNYDLPNDTAYTETCASISLMFFARRMLQINPESRYGDVMELALYNTVLSGMALDGKSFFYVNPLEVLPEASRRDERKAHVKTVRQKWFGCACCPPNLARLLSSIGLYAYTESEDTLFIHLYIGGSIEKKVNGTVAKISIHSDLPWKEDVDIKIQGTGEVFTVAVRIPGWGKEYELLCADGVEKKESQGYLYLTKRWEKGEELKLHFPMKIRRLEANPLVRETIGKIAIMRGPIVYCMEEVDNGANLHLLSANKVGSAEIEEREIAGTMMTCIKMGGYRQIVSQEEATLYHDASEEYKEVLKLSFVPYYAWANRGENEMQVWVRKE
ncbi:glycoside hydrolase family 127 protein [Lacrimispora algidixylanolytica]|uniref:Glycosyhydrolase n=1 Tax=Lacrimispora algidixylanolytica TaxID=94868 RepID=A0A419SYB6_9FIRM|nr:beta-L-arabinofuranosidase domain-containing protein [Lacrimispora algidixylanolytica]RKD30181.1 hypothetical protein BET01_06195 [Lacrimispora algidixylanolytica]